MRLPIGVRLASLGLIVLTASAHVGTTDVSFAGNAGPYPVRVSVRQPGVVPGLADINIRVEGTGVSRVLVTALRRVGNSGEAPPPDIAEPVNGAPGLYSAQLWLMVRGAHSVIVTVEGDAGAGTVDIPVVASATRRLAMTRGLQGVLAGGGLFLIVGMLTIVGAATRESVLQPGEAPGTRERRRARIAVSAAALTIAVLLFGGWKWIRAEANLFNRRIDRSWSAEAAIETQAGVPQLEFAITDSLWIMRDNPEWLTRNNRYRRTDLIADHGKLMHMFLVREPALDAFAHIHPVTADMNRFTVAMPPLPEGTYRIYADISQEDGSSQTLVARVESPGLTEAAAGADRDPDDAWWTPADNSGADVTVTWVNSDEPLQSATDAELVFRIAGPDGLPLALEPYMGMQGHAMLNREDGNVFVHLHPVGMVSMAAFQAVRRADGESADASMAGMNHGGEPGVVRFPLVVPAAGHYRIWMQVRHGGDVITRSFVTDIR